ncbi:MAG: N-acetyl-gamma-glutamyl-phosphate reductase [Nitrospinae bacterium]|nr:N-acetyl-gamma-glutamyl-phosphate reductase [Nitrospinota bacterium]
MIKVGIVGASGYTGLELIRILSKHPEIKISILTSERYANSSVSSIFPSLLGWVDMKYKDFLPEEIIDKSDLIFTALPHKKAMSIIPIFLKSGKRVIDMSADYRIKDPHIYERWYSNIHTSPELLNSAVYGLPEIYRAEIKSAKLVANPGCYPTSVILAMAPLIKTDLIYNDSIIVDSKSGISGAGRSPDLAFQFAECNENVRAYSISVHRHIPEIEQELSILSGEDIKVSFTPHLIPMTRGLLSTIYVNLREIPMEGYLLERYKEFYKYEPFVRLMEEGRSADTHNVTTSNYCDIGINVDVRTKRVVLTSAIDNLVKGASGQAVQNMNILYGFREDMGLECPGIFP